MNHGMCKRVLAVVCMTVAPWLAQAADNTSVETMFRDSMAVEVKEAVRPAFDGIFAHSVYDVEYTMFSDNERFSPGSDYRVFVVDSRLEPIFMPGSNTSLAYFDDLIEPAFRLTKGTAPDFMSALKALMPEKSFDDVEGKAIRQVDGQWQFVTGTFFDDSKGFVVSVDDEGRVEEVAYNLKLKAPE